MRFDVITLLPEFFSAYLGESIMKKALEKKLFEINIYDLRKFATDKHKTVDDYPYGGGPGMVLKPGPLSDAIEFVKSDGLETLTVMLTPQGRRFDQSLAEELHKESRRLLLICGRYEGIDDRIREKYADMEVSIGDYVITGGELPALVIIDVVARLLPGVLGDENSSEEESFSWGILDYPHFTRPPEWKGMSVPDVLLSGNHGMIARWRRKEALRTTIKRRPDLLEKALLSAEDKKLITEIQEE